MLKISLNLQSSDKILSNPGNSNNLFYKKGYEILLAKKYNRMKKITSKHCVWAAEKRTNGQN